MSSDARTTYQEGSYEKVPRAKGPDVWVFRWRDPQGKQRRMTIGNIQDLPKLADAKRAQQISRPKSTQTAMSPAC